MPEIPSFSNDMDISTTTLSGTGVQAQVNANYFPGPDADLWGNFEWDMISLGLEEPLPTQDVVDEL